MEPELPVARRVGLADREQAKMELGHRNASLATAAPRRCLLIFRGVTPQIGRQPQELETGEAIEYGYMWWPAWTEASIEDEAYAAVGIQGQYIYINPPKAW